MNRRVTIASTVGLHARPAALFAKAAAAQQSPVTIAKVADGQAGEAVDAASVLALMGLGAMHGDEVELTCADESALAELAELLARDHDAEPA
ncbi:HPr family phosphocarrier protein [Saccharopolyspora sp. HNM0983]|uniref:Phosphocarrier protein HPr n=1 Tax=Saccharopolyspora montiporae TaxID=2781240 RepID=A0A929G341_9PSEU|nr:HPr family phosphocarrier protein [Saccharopolyspora sp. HNM0983]MBE9376508.1 HPr family phosphocarrier protein [Saccharopolyspora sp. HNM0983]